MWYECIPSMLIIATTIAALNPFAYMVHKYFNNGRPYNRIYEQPWDRYLYRQDEALTGSPYIVNGLEVIPDEDEPKKD